MYNVYLSDSSSSLTSEHLHLSSRSCVYLVRDHVVKFLVIDDAYEDFSHEFLASHAIVEDFAARVAEPELHEALPNFVWSFISERCSIGWVSSCRRRFFRGGFGGM